MLQRQTAGTAHLFVPSYDHVLCVVHHDAGPSTAAPAIRELVPCHCTAAGKALLSERPRWSDSVLSRPLSPSTARSTTDPTTLRNELADVRARGYAIEDGEHRPGERGVAAVVRTPTGEATAALAMTSIAPFDLDAVAVHVRSGAAAISDLLAAGASDART